MQFPRVDRHGHGGGTAARVAGERARGAGRRVRAAAAHARRARPAPGAAQQGQHAVLRALPRRPARHVGRPRRQYSPILLDTLRRIHSLRAHNDMCPQTWWMVFFYQISFLLIYLQDCSCILIKLCSKILNFLRRLDLYPIYAKSLIFFQ